MPEQNVLANIDNTYDYSNILVVPEGIMYLVEYCFSVYTGFLKLIEDNMEKNKNVNPNEAAYDYKKGYNDRLEINVRQRLNDSFGFSYTDIHAFKKDYDEGKILNIGGIKITLQLGFGRGIGENIDIHENIFTISFLPYSIVFNRKSNHKDLNMDKIEQGIINTLSTKFPVGNSIFCYKK